MIYTSLNGNRIKYRAAPTETLRSVNLRLLEPGTWSEYDFLDLVWRMAGNLCTGVRLRGAYREVNKPVVHNYDLFFLIGRNIMEPQAVNKLVTEIEEEAERTLKVEVPNHARHRDKLGETGTL